MTALGDCGLEVRRAFSTDHFKKIHDRDCSLIANNCELKIHLLGQGNLRGENPDMHKKVAGALRQQTKTFVRPYGLSWE